MVMVQGCIIAQSRWQVSAKKNHPEGWFGQSLLAPSPTSAAETTEALLARHP
jgi:hypothetical protein